MNLYNSYFAETKREFISLLTKHGLEAAKALGKQLGRPKGNRNKKTWALDPFRAQIQHYLEQGGPIASVQKLINAQLEKLLTYNSYKHYVQHDPDLTTVAAL
jgi:hypothetical protein